MWGTHQPLGFLLLILILARLVWAMLNHSRRPESVNPMAKLGHLGLYGILFAIPGVALLRQYGSGESFEPFALRVFSGFEGDEIGWMVILGDLTHSWLGWIGLAMIVGHITMVFVHRYRPEDEDVLARMVGERRH